MPKKKKRFIDKNNASTYSLIHRSQKDPLQADEDAPQRVFVSTEKVPDDSRKERLATLGIYYDDDYNYEQHLRNADDLKNVKPDMQLESFRIGTSTKSRVKLPTEVLPSETEEKVGMLELAAPVSGPKLDWDPDIVAALDSDNDEPMEEEGLEDDFIQLANQEGGDSEDDVPHASSLGSRQRDWIQSQLRPDADGADFADLDEMPELESGDDNSDSDLSSNFGDDEDDEVGSLPEFSDEETRTRFTNYSMSSSVMRRNEALTLVDDKFEQLYAEYDEDEIGALDHEDIDGKVSTTGPMMGFLLKEFEKQKLEVKNNLPADPEQNKDVNVYSDTDSDQEELTKVAIDEGQKWDCESILSTYSNLYNHPKVIEEPWKKKSGKIELTKKLGIPKESLPSQGLTRRQLQALDRESGADPVVTPVRPKDETAEEKKARKSVVKQERKERRVEKKNTKLAFREEEAIQRRQHIGSKNSTQANRII